MKSLSTKIMKSLSTKKFKSPLSIDNGYRNSIISEQADHSFELFVNDDKTEGMVEWVVGVEGYEEDEFVTHIGLWFDENREVYEYDGVFELPKQLTDWLIELGYKVNEVVA
jgi:sulfite reductase beta subunit-like hemoprotein